MNVCKMQLL